jgi:Glycosyl transferase family 2.
VFNEAATIEESISEVLQTPFNKEIIIVFDRFTDGTRGILAVVNNP